MKCVRFSGCLLVMCFTVLIIFGNNVSATEEYKMAVMFPGSIQDADFNASDDMTMQDVKKAALMIELFEKTLISLL